MDDCQEVKGKGMWEIPRPLITPLAPPLVGSDPPGVRVAIFEAILPDNPLYQICIGVMRNSRGTR